jgi:hypothetical protein
LVRLIARFRQKYQVSRHWLPGAEFLPSAVCIALSEADDHQQAKVDSGQSDQHLEPALPGPDEMSRIERSSCLCRPNGDGLLLISEVLARHELTARSALVQPTKPQTHQMQIKFWLQVFGNTIE